MLDVSCTAIRHISSLFSVETPLGNSNIELFPALLFFEDDCARPRPFYDHQTNQNKTK